MKIPRILSGPRLKSAWDCTARQKYVFMAGALLQSVGVLFVLGNLSEGGLHQWWRLRELGIPLGVTLIGFLLFAASRAPWKEQRRIVQAGAALLLGLSVLYNFLSGGDAYDRVQLLWGAFIGFLVLWLMPIRLSGKD